jgi:endonuclease YncB( thermonuclease family)
MLLLAPASAHAQALSGPVRAVDGDTLFMTGTRIRLFGIDAPETDQTCVRDGEAWACGSDASAVLAGLVAGRQVNCTQHDRDSYGRMVASCRVGKVDLAEAMVSAGYAIALPRFSDAYVPTEARAKALGIGIWGSQFEQPETYRATHQLQQPAAAAEPAAPSQASASVVYYRNCDEALAAGVAPLRLGEAGYRPEMDGDSDGVACEPFRGRS